MESNPGRQRRSVWGLKNEEYLADFCLVSRRTLDEQQHKLFKFHYLLGADWKLCCRKLGIERGEFFHETYRIEQKLGRTFRELEPFALFPLDEYFNSSGRQKANGVIAFPIESEDLEGAELLAKFPTKRAA